MTRHKTSVSLYTERNDLATLRELAAACGLLQTRGAGAGTVGSVSRLLDVIATGYTANPAAVKLYVAAMKEDWAASQAAD